MSDANTPCPCGNGLAYGECCGRFVEGNENAPTAEALMRSRYTAFTRKNIPYILASWHSSTRPGDLSLEESLDWQGLSVLATDKGGVDDQEGMVEFVATFSIHGHSQRLHERSRFVREEGKWFYVHGIEVPAASDKTGRNAPCPCGSGKKYKKCCLAKG
ncbi:MAG: YchJ family protein [Thermodesulfobacteriota bacterium]